MTDPTRGAPDGVVAVASRRNRSVAAVRRLTADDIAAASSVLARAFDADPFLSRVITDPATRRRLLEVLAGYQLRAALPYGHTFGIDHDDRLVGLALWHPPSTSPFSLEAAAIALRESAALLPPIAALLPRAGLRTKRRPVQAARYLAARRVALRAATREPAWYLAYLAVDPDQQGRGIGRRLLTHVLERCDEDAMPVWLQTSDPANPPLYRRFGFRTTHHGEGGGWLPDWWVMRREPVETAARR